jgi:hypothetical protein
VRRIALGETAFLRPIASATSVKETSFLPVVTSDLDASALQPPLSELSVLALAERPQVEQLVYEIGRLLRRELEPPHSYADMLLRLVRLASAAA